jgi:hypothetical protein
MQSGLCRPCVCGLLIIMDGSGEKRPKPAGAGMGRRRPSGSPTKTRLPKPADVGVARTFLRECWSVAEMAGIAAIFEHVQGSMAAWRFLACPDRGHVRLELRNVVAKYPYEKSCRFPGIQPNSGHRDYSHLSCGVAETQLGLVPLNVLSRSIATHHTQALRTKPLGAPRTARQK